MFGLGDPQFYFYFFLFFLSVAISWTLPGVLILFRFPQQSLLQRLLFGTVIGQALWGAQGFIFGYLQARWLTYLYLLAMIVLFVRHGKKHLTRWHFPLGNIDLLALLFILVGSAIQLVTVFPSGLRTPEGIYFHQINAHDGVFYIALIEEIVTRFPPEQPGAAGLPITNYHYWSNLIMAELARVWHLPIMHLYFQYIPTLLAPLLGGVMWFVVKEVASSVKAARWGVFFHYFSADITYLFMWLLHHQFSFSTVTIDNGAIQFINMPQAFAKLLFLTGIFFFTKWLRTKQKGYGYLCILNFSILVGFKVYFGIAASLGICVVFLFEWWKSVRQFSSSSLILRLFHAIKTQLFFAMLIFCFAIISALIYFPVNKNSGGLFFVPIAWPKLLLNSEKLNWNEWWLRLQVYEAEQSVPHLMVWLGLAVAIFFGVIYSSRLIGLLPSRTLIKKVGFSLYLFFITIVVFCTLIGMNFLQTSGGYNIFNFFIVALTILSILSAINVDLLWQRKKWWITVSLIVLLSLPLPRIFYTGWNFAQTARLKNNSTLISHQEIEALTFLKKNHPEIKVLQSSIEAPLENRTPYLSFFAGTQGYYSGRAILGDHNQPTTHRKNLVTYIFQNPNSVRSVELMHWYGIDALYIQKSHTQGDQHLPFRIRYSAFKKLYENEEVLILVPRKKNEQPPTLTSFNITESEEW